MPAQVFNPARSAPASLLLTTLLAEHWGARHGCSVLTGSFLLPRYPMSLPLTSTPQTHSVQVSIYKVFKTPQKPSVSSVLPSVLLQ